MRQTTVHSVLWMLLLSAFLGSAVLWSAGAKKADLSKLKIFKAMNQRPRMAMMLPNNKKISKSMKAQGVQPMTWVFKHAADVQKAQAQFWLDKKAEWEKLIADGGDPEKNLKLSPEGEAMLKKNIQLTGMLVKGINMHFASVRIAVVDKKDPNTALYVRVSELQKNYTLADAVAAAKQRPPAWRLGKTTGKVKVVKDQENTWFKKTKWEGHELLLQTEKGKQPGDTYTIQYYDNIFLYRKILRNGGTFLIEVHGRWNKSTSKTEKFKMTLAYLLSGLRILD